MAKEKFNEEDGVWRTIGGRKVFIRKGQNLADAMIESGKFKGQKNKKGARESYREEIDKIKDERKEAKSEEQRLKREREGLLNRYSNAKRDIDREYYGEGINNATKWIGEEKEKVENYDAMLDKENTKTKQLEKSKAYDKEHGKAYPYREQYKQENKELLEEEKDWKNYRDRQQKSLNRSTNQESKDRFRSERDDSQKILDKTREKLNQKADEILGKQDKSTNDSFKNMTTEKAKANLEKAQRESKEQQDRWNKQVEEARKYNDELYEARAMFESGKISEGAYNQRKEKALDNYLNRTKSKDKLNYNENTEKDNLYGGTFQKKESTNELSNKEVKSLQHEARKMRNEAERTTGKDSEEYWKRFDDINEKLGKDRIDTRYDNESTNEKFGYNEARDILNQLNDEGSDFTFGEIEVDKYNQNYKDTGKLKTEVSVFMPDERGYTTRELEIPIDKNETRESFEEKLRDWQSRHSSPDTWEDEDFKSTNKSTNETMNNAIREKASKKETKELTPNYSKYSADEQDILDRYGEDYGYPKGNNLKNLKGQIDYMRIPSESIRKTAERLVEGGDFLIYNDDIKDYLKERNIKFNDDNFFDKYKNEMAEKIEKLYNDASNSSMNNTIRKQANMKNEWKLYLKDHPDSKMSLSEYKKMKK